jgi:hypothetical protein
MHDLAFLRPCISLSGIKRSFIPKSHFGLPYFNCITLFNVLVNGTSNKCD